MKTEEVKEYLNELYTLADFTDEHDGLLYLNDEVITQIVDKFYT